MCRKNFRPEYHCFQGLDEETEEATADLEEKEALALQKKMAEQLDEEDFGLEIFKVGESTL